tara:strand:- start:16 stop:351 length:336 start_codon:yes stop_codon:yes gene_type:complete
MKLTNKQLKQIIKEELNKVLRESDQWHGKMPEDLWGMSDWEDARDMLGHGDEFEAYFQNQAPEHLQMKIEQLEQEIQDEKGSMGDPQNQYDSGVAGKESLLAYIKDLLAER